MSEDGSPGSQPGGRKESRNGGYLSQDETKDILKDILKLPGNPQFQLKSQLITNPKAILEEYLPDILKFLEWSTIFFLGAFGYSYAWIITLGILYFSRNYSRGRNPPNKSGEKHEKETLKSQTEQLPSWVMFPDVERVEWINTIIKKVWPNIGQITQQLAKRLVEPKIKEILSRMRLEELSNFKLRNVLLGSTPARIGGIKVYDRNTARDEIIMDIELSYQGDACVDFSVQNFSCEICEVSFRGTARVTMKPLMDNMPVVGGFELYFMQMPEYDYKLGKMANLAQIPGISNIIKTVLDNIIRRGFVWPNRFNFFFPIESVKRLQDQTFAMPSPQGVLNVAITKGRHLMKKDKHLLGGKSDPYVILALGEKKISFRDQYAKGTVDPDWHYTTGFAVEEVSGLDLKLEVYDYDNGTEDDFLGRTSFPVESAMDKQFRDRWVRLDDAKHGEIQVSLYWSPVAPASTQEGSIDYCVVSIFVDSCRNISTGKTTPPFSKCELSLTTSSSAASSPAPLTRKASKKWIPSEKYESYTTKARGPSEDPVFQEGHFFLCRSPSSDSIAVQVVDHRTGLVLGTTSITVSYILSLPDKQFSRMEWGLKNTNSNLNASVVLSAKIYA